MSLVNGSFYIGMRLKTRKGLEMNKEYRFNIKKVIHGDVRIYAENEEEARKRFYRWDFVYFENLSDFFPVDCVVIDVEVYNEETDQYEKVKS
jgi:hypothetical protein